MSSTDQTKNASKKIQMLCGFLQYAVYDYCNVDYSETDCINLDDSIAYILNSNNVKYRKRNIITTKIDPTLETPKNNLKITNSGLNRSAIAEINNDRVGGYAILIDEENKTLYVVFKGSSGTREAQFNQTFSPVVQNLNKALEEFSGSWLDKYLPLIYSGHYISEPINQEGGGKFELLKYVHWGLQLAFWHNIDFVINDILSFEDIENIVFTGHSLGASLAYQTHLHMTLIKNMNRTNIREDIAKFFPKSGDFRYQINRRIELYNKFQARDVNLSSCVFALPPMIVGGGTGRQAVGVLRRGVTVLGSALTAIAGKGPLKNFNDNDEPTQPTAQEIARNSSAWKIQQTVENYTKNHMTVVGLNIDTDPVYNPGGTGKVAFIAAEGIGIKAWKMKNISNEMKEVTLTTSTSNRKQLIKYGYFTLKDDSASAGGLLMTDIQFHWQILYLILSFVQACAVGPRTQAGEYQSYIFTLFARHLFYDSSKRTQYLRRALFTPLAQINSPKSGRVDILKMFYGLIEKKKLNSKQKTYIEVYDGWEKFIKYLCENKGKTKNVRTIVNSIGGYYKYQLDRIDCENNAGRKQLVQTTFNIPGNSTRQMLNDAFIMYTTHRFIEIMSFFMLQLPNQKLIENMGTVEITQANPKYKTLASAMNKPGLEKINPAVRNGRTYKYPGLDLALKYEGNTNSTIINNMLIKNYNNMRESNKMLGIDAMMVNFFGGNKTSKKLNIYNYSKIKTKNIQSIFNPSTTPANLQNVKTRLRELYSLENYEIAELINAIKSDLARNIRKHDIETIVTNDSLSENEKGELLKILGKISELSLIKYNVENPNNSVTLEFNGLETKPTQLYNSVISDLKKLFPTSSNSGLENFVVQGIRNISNGKGSSNGANNGYESNASVRSNSTVVSLN